jgi:filamin
LEIRKVFVFFLLDATHIVDGKLKLILGLIWTLILHYSISLPMWEFEQPDAPGSGRDATPKQKLMAWIQEKLPPELPITNFTSDWNDGRAIGALVDACAPGMSRSFCFLSSSLMLVQ